MAKIVAEFLPSFPSFIPGRTFGSPSQHRSGAKFVNHGRRDLDSPHNEESRALEILSEEPFMVEEFVCGARASHRKPGGAWKTKTYDNLPAKSMSGIAIPAIKDRISLCGNG